MITQSELKANFSYDPATGIFTRTSSAPGPKGKLQTGSLRNGYVNIKYKGTPYPAHRLAWLYMTGDWPEGDIDHINHKRDDNRWANLRDVPRIGNLRNLPPRKSMASGVFGVQRDARQGKWVANIRNGGKLINLGSFDEYEHAVIARRSAEKALGFHKNHGR